MLTGGREARERHVDKSAPFGTEATNLATSSDGDAVFSVANSVPSR